LKRLINFWVQKVRFVVDGTTNRKCASSQTITGLLNTVPATAAQPTSSNRDNSSLTPGALSARLLLKTFGTFLDAQISGPLPLGTNSCALWRLGLKRPTHTPAYASSFSKDSDTGGPQKLITHLSQLNQISFINALWNNLTLVGLTFFWDGLPNTGP